jgi:hypothetical protein
MRIDIEKIPLDVPKTQREAYLKITWRLLDKAGN